MAEGGLEQWFLDTVHGRARGPVASLTRGLLALVAAGYGLGLRLRELTYRLGLVRPVRVKAEVISVGNLTLGGTGKTPAVIHLARQYRAAGRRPAILFRGHGARRLAGVHVVHDGAKLCLGVAEAGDEPVLTAQLLGDVPVLAGKDRRLTARAAVEQFGADVLLLDDGFQYRRLAIDRHILLLDATQPFGVEKLFPAGTLRDPVGALRLAAEIWLTRTDHPAAVDLTALGRRLDRLAPGVPRRLTRHAPQRLRTLSGQARELSELAGQSVLALAGIGNPEAFAATLAGLGAKVADKAFFADHHPYSREDLTAVARRAGAARVVTTEKDAVRLTAWPADQPEPWVLGIELVVGEEFQA
jgi:tetraacyldisaccharide 4'-kinase